MKIKIEKRYQTKIKKFKSNKFLKKTYLKELDITSHYRSINVLHLLKKISGINNSTSYFLIAQVGISPFKSINKINKNINFIKNSVQMLTTKWEIGLGRVAFTNRVQNINKLKSIWNNRGLRHKNNLPVRGQKTYSNAATRKKFRII